MKPRRRIIVTGAPRPDLDARALANLLIALDEYLNRQHDNSTTASKEAPSEPDSATPTGQ